MTAYTQSGYPVITKYGDPDIEPLIVAGVSIAPGVRKGSPHAVMAWVAQEFHDTVSPLQSGQCWGFAPRDIRGGTGWSNHAGGVAVDLNSALFPQYVARMTGAQIAACRAIVAASRVGLLRRAVIRWGGDFTAGSLDQMHFEIAPGRAGKPVDKLAKKLAKKEKRAMLTAIRARKIARKVVAKRLPKLLRKDPTIAAIKAEIAALQKEVNVK